MGVKMKVCIYGLWHLGLVTASCLSAKGFNVIGLDENYNSINTTIKTLPIYEPNLKESIEKSAITFTNDKDFALNQTKIIWITFDTPVDKYDNANNEYVMNKVRDIFPYIKKDSLVIISSQLSVGTTRKLQNEYNLSYPDMNITFSYSPENLVRGKAIEGFNNPDRIIIGINNNGSDIKNNTKVNDFFMQIFDCKNVRYMSLESAEMVKHSLNSFLALSISFANEVAQICEKVEANYEDVEFALKSDLRIGKKAYLRAGEAYFGGTLGRDVNYLRTISMKTSSTTPVIDSINLSNLLHKERIQEKTK